MCQITEKAHQEDAVGAEGEEGLGRDFGLEPDLESDRLSGLLSALVGNAIGHGDGGDATGLGAHQPNRAMRRLRAVQNELRHLRRFARARFCRQNKIS